MSKIEVGRFSELLRRMLGMKGQQVVAAELSPEVSPTIQLEGPTAEWDFLKRLRQCRLVGDLDGEVGFTTVFRLRNPVASGVIAVVHLVSITPRVVGRLLINTGPQTADLVAAVNTVVPDARWNATGVTDTTLVGSTNDAADAVSPAGDAIGVFRPPADIEVVYSVPWVVMPGFAVDWGTTGVNVGLRTFVSWTERGLPALEE